jgi:branched-chain amino acid transport system substrate-binding protein
MVHTGSNSTCRVKEKGMSMGKAKKYVALVAVLVILAMTVTACSGGTSSTAGGAKATTKVAIGVGAPLTDGAVALGKGMVRATKLAVKEANASQEVKDLGITFEVVEGDDKGDPTTGGNVATQFASNPNLVGVMGHLNSGVTRVAVKIYNQANIVQISPANTLVEMTQMGMTNYFRTCANDGVQGAQDADYAFKDLSKKVAYVVDDSTPYGVGLADEFVKEFEKAGGKVVSREKTADKDTDFKALVTKIKAANPDIVFYGGIYNAGALFAKQLKEGGVTALFMSGDGCKDPEFVKLAGIDVAKGDMISSMGLPISELPLAQKFQVAYKAEYPSDELAAYDLQSYDAAKAIIKAIVVVAKAQGSDKVTTTEGKKAIIAAVAKSDFAGVTGIVKFDSKGDTLNKSITIYKIADDGTFSVAKFVK